MTFSYVDPGASFKDEVRFSIGDTDPKRPLLQDEEIAFLLVQAGGDPADAAIRACESVIAKLGRLCDQTVGSVSKSYSQMAGGFQNTLDILRRRAVSTGGRPIVGGISRISKQVIARNPDRVRPQFTTRMFMGRATTAPVFASSLGPDSDYNCNSTDDRDRG